MKRPLIIGITGSIASGKSAVVTQLQESGYKIYSTDIIGHEILFLEEVKDRLVEKFSSEILDPKSNLIDRTKLSAIVFKNKSNLDFLNSISHPFIFQKMREIINNSREDYIFFEVPLLFEAKLERHFDFIITISTTAENQLLRLMKRNRLTKHKANEKISSQLSNEIKEVKSDLVIHNNGDLLS
jgi:dephospho-CoA kinase